MVTVLTSPSLSLAATLSMAAPPEDTCAVSIREMYEEARARLGRRDLEERSLSSWLRRHAPDVAALWPDAPADGSWFDWRLELGPEHVTALDTAWQEIQRIRQSETSPQSSPVPPRSGRSRSSKRNRLT